MIKFFRNMFGSKTSGADGTTPAAGPVLNESQPAVQWLEKDDPKNPFTVNGYDCLAFVRSMLSTTQDPAVATSYSALRASDGREHIGLVPSGAVALECRLEYPFDGETSDGVLFHSSRMEEKWDIYLYADRIYFCRSWTGALSFVAHFSTTGNALVIHQVLATSSGPDMDYRYVVRQVDYLVRSHILKQGHPHPLPAGLERDPASVGLFSFSQYGWLCCFGTFDDTLRRDIRKPQIEPAEAP